MNHKIYNDNRNGVARIDLHGQINEQDAEPIVNEIEKIFQGKKHRYLLNDVSDLPTLQINKTTRKALQEGGKKLGIEKIAVVGASPMIQMIAKVVIGVLGNNTESRFLKTNAEAVVWLRREEGK